MTDYQPICTVIGFIKHERGGGDYRLQRIGTVLEGCGCYYLANAGMYHGCIGGARTVQGAIEQVRSYWHYPSVRHCEWDGRVERR